MQNFLRLNEGDIVEIIIAFINKNVGNETITEVDYDRIKRNKEIVELYNNNMNYMDIADKFGISHRRVHQILKRESEKGI